MCKWHATYCWKALDNGYNIALDLISIKSVYAKLWAFKIMGVPIVAISGLRFRVPLGSPRTKWHLDASPMAKHKVYYKEEGGAFFQVQAVLSIMNLSLSMFRLCTKVSNYALTNLLFGLCRPMWISNLLINLPSPILKLQHAPQPPTKCCKPGSVP